MYEGCHEFPGTSTTRQTLPGSAGISKKLDSKSFLCRVETKSGSYVGRGRVQLQVKTRSLPEASYPENQLPQNRSRS